MKASLINRLLNASVKRQQQLRAKDLLEILEPRLLLSSTLVNVTENHGGGNISGEQTSETILTPTSIATTASGNVTTNFGRLFDTTLDGQVYAQPLEVTNVNITIGGSKGLHDVIFVATMHDSLYAIDAESGVILWQDSFTQITNPQVATIGSPVATAGVTTIPANSTNDALVNNSDVGPELGILATPAIDSVNNILYLDANTQEWRNGTTPVSTFTIGTTDIHFVQRLWAISLSSGAVAITPTTNPPTSIEPATTGMIIGDTILDPTGNATVPSYSSYTGYKYVAGPYIQGSGDNGVNNNATRDGWVADSQGAGTPWGTSSTPEASEYIAFNALLQMNRVATTLINGEVYLGFASHGDDGPYYGWILGYNASTLANNVAFVSAPTYESYNVVSGDRTDFDAQAGFWNAGSTITTDGTYLYISAGNGAFNPNTNNFSSTYTSTDSGPSGNHTVQMPEDDDYGDAVLKLQLDLNANQSNMNAAAGVLHNAGNTYDPDGGYDANGYGLKVVDYFVPSNVFEMNDQDEDVGSGGVVLIPSSGPGSSVAPNGDPMLVTAGKEGRVYLIDADNLGGYNTQYITDGNETTAADPAPYDNVLGEYYYYETLHPGVAANNQTDKGYDIFSYFDGQIYIGLGGGTTSTRYNPEFSLSVTDLLFSSHTFSGNRTATYATIVFDSGNTTNSPLYGGRGTTATISSDSSTDTSNEIIWNNNVTQTTSDALIAYSSNGTVLFNSNWEISGQSSNTSDTLTNGNANATGVKFSIPTVANGLVYDGTGGSSGSGGHIQGTLDIFGLLNPLLHTPGTPTLSQSGASSVVLNWTRTSGDQESEDVVQRSPDGSTWTTIALLGNGATSYTDTGLTNNTKYFYRVQEVYGATSKISVSASITVAGLTLSGVVSRKPQGSGVLDINLQPVGGATASEPRFGGPTDIIFTFNEAVTLSGNFSLGLTSGSGSAVASGNTVTVTMSGATNDQLLTINLNGVQDSLSNSANFSTKMNVILGDADGSGTVDIVDLQIVANNWQGAASGPSQGDFNGDGIDDIRDLQAIATNWQAGVGGLGGGSGSGDSLLSGASETEAQTPAVTTAAHTGYVPASTTPSNNQDSGGDNDSDLLHHHFVKKWKIVLSKISLKN